MKKLISTIAFVLGIVALSFAQDATNTAISEGADALAKSKTSGVYNYVLPEGTTQDEVQKSASYYKEYFTVDYDNNTRKVTVNITGDEGSSRQVMLRLLSSVGALYVDVDGEVEQLNVHYTSYIAQ